MTNSEEDYEQIMSLNIVDTKSLRQYNPKNLALLYRKIEKEKKRRIKIYRESLEKTGKINYL